MNSFFFNAGVNTANAAIAAADRAEAAAKAAKHYAAKGATATVSTAKDGVDTVQVCGQSFWGGLKHAIEMNRVIKDATESKGVKRIAK
jgi:hypothetical protein